MLKNKKKLLSVITAIGVTGTLIASPLTDVTAKAETLYLAQNKQYTPINGNYTQGVRFKLRARLNSLYKDWWQMNLTTVNGQLKMVGPTNMPSNLTFDDQFIIHVFDANGYNKFIYRTDYRKNNMPQMNELVNGFNKANVGVGDYITIIGKDWNGTVRFDTRKNAIIKTTNNNYSQGYTSINKYNYAFKVTNDGLKETPFYWSLSPFYFGM